MIWDDTTVFNRSIELMRRHFGERIEQPMVDNMPGAEVLESHRDPVPEARFLYWRSYRPVLHPWPQEICGHLHMGRDVHLNRMLAYFMRCLLKYVCPVNVLRNVLGTAAGNICASCFWIACRSSVYFCPQC